MKISVIIANYNDKRIVRTVNSIQSQSYKNFEIIIVDGGSSCPEVLAFYEKLENKIIIEKDEGIFDAFNKGITEATGDLIYIIGSDDFLSSTEVFKLVSNLLKPDMDGVCIGCEFFNSYGRITRKWRISKISSRKILFGLMPPHLGLFLRKNLYDEVGLFEINEDKSKASDTKWLIDLAIIKPNLNIPVISDVCVYMQTGGESTGSLRGVLKQFLVVHKYAMRKKIPFKYTHSLVRSTSKLLQLNAFKKYIKEIDAKSA